MFTTVAMTTGLNQEAGETDLIKRINTMKSTYRPYQFFLCKENAL